jgi:hypothetical protein
MQGLLTIMTSSTVEVHGGTVLQAVRYDKKVNYRGMGKFRGTGMCDCLHTMAIGTFKTMVL